MPGKMPKMAMSFAVVAAVLAACALAYVLTRPTTTTTVPVSHSTTVHTTKTPTPDVTKTVTATPIPTVTQTIPASSPSTAPCPGYNPNVIDDGCGQPAPVAQPDLTSPVAVVTQFYQDLNNQDYSDAWLLGGDNIGNAPYDSWVAGYDTTESISVNTIGSFSNGTVWANITSVHTDGSVQTFYGTYTVSDGEIVGADISQTS